MLLSCTAVFAEIDDEVTFMKQLGIMQGYEDGLLHPELNVTRAEFSALLMRLCGFEAWAQSSQKQIFADVSAEHWAAGYVALAYELGVIQGYDGTYFGPEDSVTGYQAVKMLVSILGYAPDAERNGGYPQGYLARAQKLKLMKNVKINDNPITRGGVARLFTNALDAPLLERVFEGSSEKYEIGSSDLLGVLNLKKVTGLADRVYGASITGSGSLKEDEVSIDGVVYKTTFAAATEFFAKNVEAYIREENGRDTVLYMEESTNSDDALVINAEDLIKDATSFGSISYYDNGKRKTETLSGAISYIYNGTALTTADMYDSSQNPKNELIRIDAGTITLTDLSERGTYDTVVIWSYDTLVVTTVYDDNIYGRYGAYLETDPGASGTSIKIIKNGEAADLASLRTDDVLWIAASLDGKKVRAEVSTKEPVTGTLEAVEESEPVKYTVDGTDYPVAQCYIDAKAKNKNGYEKIELGRAAMFLLDKGGRIVAADRTSEEASSQDYLYGYMTEYADYTKGGTAGASMRLLTQENRFVNFNIGGKERVKFGRLVGGSYVKTTVKPQELINWFSTNSFSGLLGYELDENDNITAVYLPSYAGDPSNLSEDGTKLYRYYSNGVIRGDDGDFIVDEDTWLFHIPNGGDYEDDFAVKKVPQVLGNGSGYYMKLFDVDNNHVGCVELNNKRERFDASRGDKEVYISKVNSPVMLIEKTYFKTSDDGMDYLVVEGYEGDGRKSVLVSDTLSSLARARQDLTPGKIIQYQCNDALLSRAYYSEDTRVMEVYEVLLDCTKQTISPFQTWDNSSIAQPNAERALSYGSVEDYRLPNLSLLTYRTQNGSFSAPMVIDDGAVVYRYNRGEKRIDTLRHEDIHIGQNVFVWQRYNNVRMVVIVAD